MLGCVPPRCQESRRYCTAAELKPEHSRLPLPDQPPQGSLRRGPDRAKIRLDPGTEPTRALPAQFPVERQRVLCRGRTAYFAAPVVGHPLQAKVVHSLRQEKAQADLPAAGEDDPGHRAGDDFLLVDGQNVAKVEGGAQKGDFRGRPAVAATAGRRLDIGYHADRRPQPQS